MDSLGRVSSCSQIHTQQLPRIEPGLLLITWEAFCYSSKVAVLHFLRFYEVATPPETLGPFALLHTSEPWFSWFIEFLKSSLTLTSRSSILSSVSPEPLLWYFFDIFKPHVNQNEACFFDHPLESRVQICEQELANNACTTVTVIAQVAAASFYFPKYASSISRTLAIAGKVPEALLLSPLRKYSALRIWLSKHFVKWIFKFAHVNTSLL